MKPKSRDKPGMVVLEVTSDGMNTVARGLDTTILAQRTAFLRPDSLVAVIMLADENDCSVMDSGGRFRIPASSTLPGLRDQSKPRVLPLLRGRGGEPSVWVHQPDAGSQLRPGRLSSQGRSPESALLAAEKTLRIRPSHSDLHYPSRSSRLRPSAGTGPLRWQPAAEIARA
jgi:hypothetical protein